MTQKTEINEVRKLLNAIPVSNVNGYSTVARAHGWDLQELLALIPDDKLTTGEHFQKVHACRISGSISFS
jgi:hypothetical protein